MRTAVPFLMAAAAVVLLAQQSAAQASNDPIGDWMAKAKISIRKTFDGAKDEQKPAAIFWTHEPSGTDKHYSFTDIGVKMLDFDLFGGRHGAYALFSPVAEYHRSSIETKPVSKWSTGGKLEILPVGLRIPNDTTVKGWALAPLTMFDARYQRDRIVRRDESAYTVSVAPISNYTGLPGSDLIDSKGVLRARYFVYGGAERYQVGSPGKDTTGLFVYGRIWLETYPIATLTRDFVQLTADLSHRWRQSGSWGATSKAADLALGLNFYLDSAAHFGIGGEVLEGRDVLQQLAVRRRRSVALKVKF